MIALLNGISSTCNQRRRPLRPISDNNCERITRSIEQDRFSFCATRKRSAVRKCDPLCATVCYAFSAKFPDSMEISVKWKFELFLDHIFATGNIHLRQSRRVSPFIQHTVWPPEASKNRRQEKFSQQRSLSTVGSNRKIVWSQQRTNRDNLELVLKNCYEQAARGLLFRHNTLSMNSLKRVKGIEPSC